MKESDLKQRLVRIVTNAVDYFNDHIEIKSYPEYIAEALIEAGIFIPKFKIGQEVWARIACSGDAFVGSCKVMDCTFNSGSKLEKYTLEFNSDGKHKKYGGLWLYERLNTEIYATEAEALAELAKIKEEK